MLITGQEVVCDSKVLMMLAVSYYMHCFVTLTDKKIKKNTRIIPNIPSDHIIHAIAHLAW